MVSWQIHLRLEFKCNRLRTPNGARNFQQTGLRKIYIGSPVCM
jgi:hypothetical protein